MPTKEPMFWVIPIVAGLVSGGGGSAGVNYLWAPEPPPPTKDLVLEYRVGQCERRGGAIMQKLTDLETKVSKLPPRPTREKLAAQEDEIRRLSDAMIRLERHGHPELQYENEE